VARQILACTERREGQGVTPSPRPCAVAAWLRNESSRRVRTALRRSREGVYEIAKIAAERIGDEGKGDRAVRRAWIVGVLICHGRQLRHCLVQLSENGHVSVVQQRAKREHRRHGERRSRPRLLRGPHLANQSRFLRSHAQRMRRQCATSVACAPSAPGQIARCLPPDHVI
jgi:hypothetical protein